VYPVPDSSPLPIEHQEHPIALAVEECYRCGEPIEEGEEHCPRCGRRLYRVCFCGWRIPVDAESCPHCHADWSGTVRVRRKSHSRRFSSRRLGSYALLGAGGALLLALICSWVVIKLAERALPEGQAMPDGLADQFALAWHGGAELMGTAGERLSRLGAGLGIVLAILLVGAIIGTLLYLLNEDLVRVRWPWQRRKKRVQRRRVR